MPPADQSEFAPPPLSVTILPRAARDFPEAIGPIAQLGLATIRRHDRKEPINQAVVCRELPPPDQAVRILHRLVPRDQHALRHRGHRLLHELGLEDLFHTLGTEADEQLKVEKDRGIDELLLLLMNGVQYKI